VAISGGGKGCPTRDSPRISLLGRGQDRSPAAGQRARSEVGRLADQPALLGVAAAYQVADHDNAGGDADPHGQRLAMSIEPRRGRRRADQIAEHHRQLAALGRRGGLARRRRDDILAGLEPGDCRQQLAPVPDRRDTEPDQVFGRELGQHLAVDVVGEECRRVALEPRPASQADKSIVMVPLVPQEAETIAPSVEGSAWWISQIVRPIRYGPREDAGPLQP